MFAFVFGFAQINAQDIPDGVMPKRQVVGTGVTPSTTAPSTTSPNPPSSTTPDPPQSTTSPNNPPQSTTPPTNGNNGPTTTPGSGSGNGGSSSSNNNGGGSQQSSTSVPTTIAVTTTNGNGQTVTSHISTHTLVAASSGPVETVQGSKNSVVKIGSTTIDPATLSHKTVITSALLGKSTEHRTYTSFWTSDGQVFSSVVTANKVVPVTTGYATATIAPSLANGGGNGSNLSEHTKSIVGGVVGGIGGAAIIGGLAFVAWRLWGKKKREAGVYDEFGGGSEPGSIGHEKRSSGMTFDTEPYNNPGGRVNTASNF